MWMPLERYGELNASLPGTETFHFNVGHNGADYGTYSHSGYHPGQSCLTTLSHHTLPAENLSEDTDEMLGPLPVHNPSVTSRYGSLLLSAPADAPSSNDVVAFEGLDMSTSFMINKDQPLWINNSLTLHPEVPFCYAYRAVFRLLGMGGIGNASFICDDRDWSKK